MSSRRPSYIPTEDATNLPLIAIAGRPNVGKSTLFNRLIGKRRSIVSDFSGVTRDSIEERALIRGCEMRLCDTAGLEDASSKTIAGRMTESSERALADADVVLFCIDARAGVTPDDIFFARRLRKLNPNILLVANKAETSSARNLGNEGYSLGLGAPIDVSAEHGLGLGDLMAAIADKVEEAGKLVPYVKKPKKKKKEEEQEQDEEEVIEPERPLRLVIVGRPNAGKSTLLNCLLGDEKMLVGPEAGITRDSVSFGYEDRKGAIQLVDTAGLRKRARAREDGLERMSVSSTLESVKHSDIVLVVIDAVRGMDEQDLQIARFVEKEGRGCIIALNKWDLVDDPDYVMKKIRERLDISLAQLRNIPIITFSALTGQGVKKIFPVMRKLEQVWRKRIGTGELNRWFEMAIDRHPPPLVSGKRLKLRYITQARVSPPTFVVFGTRVNEFPESYKRYLTNSLRESFGLDGIPIRIQLRAPKNPFADKAKK